jgi:hypothetical protein
MQIGDSLNKLCWFELEFVIPDRLVNLKQGLVHQPGSTFELCDIGKIARLVAQMSTARTQIMRHRITPICALLIHISTGGGSSKHQKGRGDMDDVSGCLSDGLNRSSCILGIDNVRVW